MAEYLVTDTDMTTVANAIRTRGGTSEQLSFPNGMATAIANIGAGAGWTRPTEWGERPAEFTAEKALPKASRTMDALYLLYHNEQGLDALHRFVGLNASVSTGTYKVERGYMVGTTFTVEETVSGIASGSWYEVGLGNVSREYVLFKITPEAVGAYITNAVRGWSDSSSVRSTLGIYFLEAYGRLKVSAYRILGGNGGIFPATRFVDILTYGGGAFATYNMFFANGSTECIDSSDYEFGETTSMYCMFYSTGSNRLVTLYVSGWDTSNVSTMERVFSDRSSLTALDVSNWDTGAVTNMTCMFYGCSRLTALDVSNWDTGAVTNMSYMFQYCSSLVTLDLSNWDMSNVTNVSAMFTSCTALTNVTGGAFKISVSFSNSSFLTKASAQSIVNALVDVSSGTAQTITFNSAVKNRFTSEEQTALAAIASPKGWSIVW